MQSENSKVDHNGDAACISGASVSKEQMVTHIKRWIQYDNEIKKLQDELKSKKELRKQHTNHLVEIMKTNEIDCFDVNNGKLIYTKTKVKAPLNKGQMMQALMQFYNNDEVRVRELGDHLMSARQEKVNESIRRKVTKIEN
jgi:DNA-directed RNA polymerase subunit F